MNKWYSIAATVLFSLNLSTAQAMGGEHSTGESCEKPGFSKFQPPKPQHMQKVNPTAILKRLILSKEGY